MRPIRAVLLFLIGAVVSLTLTYMLVVRPRIKAWGVDPSELEMPLPGDELVAEPNAIETRGLDIEAPAAKIWPYLVQMGFGRAGWYSYDQQSKSVEGIVPEFQHLDEGDIMPISQGGGFEVKTVDAERALVLYTDTAIVKAQAEKAQAEGKIDVPTAGPRMGGARINASYPEFAASWAFYLKPTVDGKTRLIERFRAKTPGSGPASAVLGEVMGTGIVLLTRKQMLGIKERAERAEQAELSGAAEIQAEPETPEMGTEPLTGSHEPQIDIPNLN